MEGCENKPSGEVEKFKIGILVVSDEVFDKKITDLTGKYLKDKIAEGALKNGEVTEFKVTQNKIEDIKNVLIHWVDYDDVQLILTTGGVGFKSTDVTPEATEAIIEKDAPGIAHVMYSENFKAHPYCVLSRQKSGIRRQCLIVNLPGSPKGCQEAFQTISSVLPHAVAIINNSRSFGNEDHTLVRVPITNELG